MRLILILSLLACISSAALGQATRQIKTDVCIYGGTSAGVAAAVAAVREGKSAILIEPGRHLGGMTTGGLGCTDFGNKAVIGGLSRAFYRDLGKHYGRDEAWFFEPHAAETVMGDWVRHYNINVIFNHRLQDLKKSGRDIQTITLEKAPFDATGAPTATAIQKDAMLVEARVFIDATYEGDLLAAAKVRYTVGRESSAQYGEPLNGIRARTPKHQFLVRVDPYLKPGDPASGLIPLISAGDGGQSGDGDQRVQAYNFRMCLTKKADNKLPITPPPGYDPRRYELLARYFDALVAAKKPISLGQFLKIDMMPGEKTDINNNGPISTDFIGESYTYPDADYATRAKIWKAHQDYVRGLLYALATHPRVPASIRREMGQWGFCKDEFQDTGGWPHALYIREARRMIGRMVVTQADCEHKRVCDDSIGMGAYNMDSHNCNRIVKDGAVENEGDVQVGPKGPYPLSYKAITPRSEECGNLLVPVCLSASHIAYGSIRMEPVFMVVGESAAIAACQAIDENKPVQEIDYPRLREKLLKAGQVLAYEPAKK